MRDSVGTAGEKPDAPPRPDSPPGGGNLPVAAEPAPRPERSAKEAGIRAVVRAVAKRTAEIRAMPAKERPSGDALTEACVRAAAEAAAHCCAQLAAATTS